MKPETKYNHGYMLKHLPPHTQLVQVRGDERKIARDDWSKKFVVPITQKKVKKGEEDTDLNCADELIILSEEEMLELFMEFPPEYSYFSQIAGNVIQSPYDVETLDKVLRQWYNQREHHSGFSEGHLQYYERTNTNKWFYSIVNMLEESKKQEWLGRFSHLSIDPDGEIDMAEKFDLNSMRKNEYGYKEGIGVYTNRFITDLKRCVAVIDAAKPFFIVKTYEAADDTYKLAFLKDTDFKDLLKSIKVGKYRKNGKVKSLDA